MAWTVVVQTGRLLIRRLGILIVGNILWLLCALPIVTLPAATGALFYLVHRVVREELAFDPLAATISDFWVGWRRFGWRSTLLALANALLLIAILIPLRFYLISEVEAVRWLAAPLLLILLAWLGVQLYLFPLLIVAHAQPLLALFRRAFFYVLGNPASALFLLLVLAAVAALSIASVGPLLLLLAVTFALAQTMALRLLRIHLGEISPPEPLP